MTHGRPPGFTPLMTGEAGAGLLGVNSALMRLWPPSCARAAAGLRASPRADIVPTIASRLVGCMEPPEGDGWADTGPRCVDGLASLQVLLRRVADGSPGR